MLSDFKSKYVAMERSNKRRLDSERKAFKNCRKIPSILCDLSQQSKSLLMSRIPLHSAAARGKIVKQEALTPQRQTKH